MMEFKQILGSSILSAAVALSVAAPTAHAAGPLQFYDVTPCRILDTRSATVAGLVGPIAEDTSISFSTNTDPDDETGAGVTANFAAQGGDDGADTSDIETCGIPTELTGGDPAAVMINIIAVDPAYDGHLRAYSSNLTLPLTSILNYKAGMNIANGATIAQFADATDANELSIYTSSEAHIVVDIIGYFDL